MGQAFHMNTVVRLNQCVRLLYPAVCNADGAIKNCSQYSALGLIFQYEFNKMFYQNTHTYQYIINSFIQAKKLGFSRLPSGKESTFAYAGDTSSVPGLGRSPAEGNGSPLQYSCPGNPMDRGGWQWDQRVREDFATEEQQQLQG